MMGAWFDSSFVRGGIVAMVLLAASCGVRKPIQEGAHAPPGAAGNDGGPEAGQATDARDALVEVSPPGFVAFRRLSDAEYVNTIQDLFGLSGMEGELLASVASFEGTDQGFDNLAGGHVVSPDRLARYFATAVLAAETAFADPQARARILVCTPDADEGPCLRTIFLTFGRRAWRRPLAADEADGLVALAGTGRAAGQDFATAVQNAVVAMLVSESFLYRIELDPESAGQDVRPLTGYELASRLSYLLWSSMPDDQLLALAESGALVDPSRLPAEVTRMLNDPRSRGFERDFLGQWLGFRELYGPTLSRPGVPEWTPELQASMAEEARLFVSDLLKHDADLSQLFFYDDNYVDWRLAELYAATIGPFGEELRLATLVTDQRRGYLGLAAPLTAITGSTTRTSPSVRGAWVLENLLCMIAPLAPGDIHWSPTPPGDTPRARTDALSKMPSCGPCHDYLDRIGLGLENYDQVGAYRRSYQDPLSNAPAIDARGVLPTNLAFDGLTGLEDLLLKDGRFYRCAVRKALTYAVGRRFDETEDARVDAVTARWLAGPQSLRLLLTTVVVDDVFRYRRAGAP